MIFDTPMSMYDESRDPRIRRNPSLSVGENCQSEVDLRAPGQFTAAQSIADHQVKAKNTSASKSECDRKPLANISQKENALVSQRSSLKRKVEDVSPESSPCLPVRQKSNDLLEFMKAIFIQEPQQRQSKCSEIPIVANASETVPKSPPADSEMDIDLPLRPESLLSNSAVSEVAPRQSATYPLDGLNFSSPHVSGQREMDISASTSRETSILKSEISDVDMLHLPEPIQQIYTSDMHIRDRLNILKRIEAMIPSLVIQEQQKLAEEERNEAERRRQEEEDVRLLKQKKAELQRVKEEIVELQRRQQSRDQYRYLVSTILNLPE
jgi:hypothetical protein